MIPNDNIATRGARIWAAVIDGLVFMPLVLLDRAMGELTEQQWVIFFYFLVSWQTSWLYSTLLHGYRGQTVGKMFRRIQVVRMADGSAVSYRRAALRDLPVILMVAAGTMVWVYGNVAWWGGWYTAEHAAKMEGVFLLILYCNVGWVLLECGSMLIHPQRRAIHDLIAGTIVVQRS